MVISPFSGSICIHCLLGGTSFYFDLYQEIQKDQMYHFLHVPSIYLPWKIVTGPTPTVKTLGRVVAYHYTMGLMTSIV